MWRVPTHGVICARASQQPENSGVKHGLLAGKAIKSVAQIDHFEELQNVSYPYEGMSASAKGWMAIRAKASSAKPDHIRSRVAGRDEID